jgi:hypothetical protein
MADIQKIQLLKGLTVDGVADRLQALGSLTFEGFSDARFKKDVFSIVLEEYLHTSRAPSNALARQAALTALLRNLRLVPFSQKELVALASTLMAAVWAVPCAGTETAREGENDPKCRRLALAALAALLDADVKLPMAIDRLEMQLAELPFGYQLTGAEDGKGAKGAWTEAQNTPKTISLDEALFIVASQVAANDADRMAREAAFRLLSRLARHEGGAAVHTSLLLQTMKKDRLADRSPKLRLMPLLSCGAIAHGIEDQFAETRLAALQCLYDLVLGAQKQRHCTEDRRLVAAAVRVLLDAVLDESELLRVAALQILHAVLKAAEKSANGSAFSVPLDEGLDVLLGLLDDGNEAVRRWAVACLGHVTVAGEDVHESRKEACAGNWKENGCGALQDRPESRSPFSLALETAARILKCFESALLKLAPAPAAEAEILAALCTLGRNLSALVCACPVALSHLLQTADVSRFRGLLGPVGPELFHLRLAFLLGVANGTDPETDTAETGSVFASARTRVSETIGPWLGRLLVRLPQPQEAFAPSATLSLLQSLQSIRPEHLTPLKYRALVQNEALREHDAGYRLATDLLLLPSARDAIYFCNGSVLVPPSFEVLKGLGSPDWPRALHWLGSLDLSSLAAIVPNGDSVQCTASPAPSDLPYPCLDLPRRISVALRGFRVIGSLEAIHIELVIRFALSSQTNGEYRQPITRVTPIGTDSTEWTLQTTLNPGAILERSEGNSDDIFITDMELAIEGSDGCGLGPFSLFKEPIKYILH